jgi:hypothetical protein
VRQLVEKLWGKPPYPRERALGAGRILLDAEPDLGAHADRSEDVPMAPGNLDADHARPAVNDLYPDYAVTSAVLAGQGIVEDFRADAPLRYTHRRTAGEDIYFVANTTAEPLAVTCTFRVKQAAPILCDAVTGTLRQLPQFTHREKSTDVPLVFAPYQSFFVVFPYETQHGPETGTNFPELTPIATLEGAWQVAFDPKWGGPAKVTFLSLEDWSKRPEDGIKYYSGIATYRKSFDLPAEATDELYLDLGTVHDLAEVSVNGEILSTVWCAPWRLRLSGDLKQTGNVLEIKVANRWTNRLIGDASKPPQERLSRTTIRPAVDGSLRPSGLLGPVRLLRTPSPAGDPTGRKRKEEKQ